VRQHSSTLVVEQMLEKIKNEKMSAPALIYILWHGERDRSTKKEGLSPLSLISVNTN
jgi:hypothetical protein